jgi:large subunit ribosomal protein L24
MSGHLGITAGNGTLSGFDLFRAKLAVENLDAIAAQTAAADALQQGTTGFDRLDVAATVAHGELTLDAARLHGSAGDADLAGGINLPGQRLDLRLAVRPALPNPPEIAIRLSGPPDHPARTPELAALSRFLAERAP